MVSTKKNKKFPMLLLGSIGLFCAFAAKAQYAPEWDDYKRWGLHINKVWYLTAKADKKYGVYDIDTKIMPGINFGFEYFIKQGGTWSYFTGIDMDFLPFYSYEYNKSIPNADMPIFMQDQFPDGYDKSSSSVKDINSHNVLAIPIGVMVNKVISHKFSTCLSASVNTKIMFSGNWSFAEGFGDLQSNKSVNLSSIKAQTNPHTFLYPCANLSAGINYMTKYSLIRLSLKLQKSFIPFFEGEYRFMNLAQSPDTYGTYKVQGDYFGLGITITPRKIKTLKY
jgi:hypothetical protein